MVVSPSPGYVEPDLLDDQQEVVGHEYVPTTPEGSDGEKAAVSHWSSHDREKRRKVEVESSPDPYFTRRCPACESGMDVPGIRHNAECRKKRASLQAQPPSSRPEGSLPSSAPPPVVVPDIPAAPLPPADLAIMDQPMLDGPAGPDEDSVAPMEFGLVDLCQCGVLFNPSSLSGLDLMSDVRFHVESIAYDGSKGECKVIDFCGSRVKLWKPSHVISDTTLGELDPEGTFKAMQKECDGLTAVKAGVILSEQKKEEFCKLHGVKPITCRWVTNEKPESDEGVRARIVVKDIARGSATARSLAISSPTPSVESLRMVLGASCGIWGAEMSLYAIDVSQAFMNSPLRDKERIVLRMPLSISTTSGEPIFLEAHKALNGLRVASLTWSVFLKDIVSKVGLACSTTEPCLYGGVIDGSPTLLLCYVDDLLIASSTDKAFHRMFKELSKHVKVRETGRIALGKDGGGSLKFLGRVISRRAGSPSLVMQVDPSYMDAACEEFGIKVPKGVVGPPDIKPNLEATSEESPISPEAHSRYRRVLGRLAWLAQTRMDLLHYTSLLASGQSEPKPGHEKALRQVLRFVATDSHVGQHFPTEDRQTHLLMVSQVIVYTDAAFAPMRVMERRSVSGAVLMYQAVTLKCFSRHQAGVSLSSCEAELHAIQGGVQEAIGLARTLAFVLRSLNIREDLAPLADLEEGECPLNIQLRTDSLSGKQLLESYDLQRRSRHIEIRLCWLRRLLNSSILELTFCRGEMNLADMFTKCVSQALFQSFRTALGFLLNDLRLSVVISGSEKQKALDDEEESESLRDLEGKPLGKTSKLTQRVFQVFQLRESFQRGRRCMLCDDVIEDDLFVEGEGEVLNSVFPSAAVVGSAASSLSGVILTEGLMASSSDKDEDRRSVKEAREEAMAKEGVPDAKESKKKRRRREKKKGKTPGEESKVDKPKEDEMEEVEVEGEEPAQSSKPPVRPPPVGPPKVKKDHLKQKVDKGRKGKGKGEKGKGKDKGKGKKGKGKGEVASPSKPRSRPPEPPTPPPGHAAVVGSTSRNVMAGMGESPTKPKLDLPGSGFTKSATGRLRCDFCRKRGHIARFCPEITFRVSLTESSIRPQKKGEKPPPQPVEEEDVAIRLKERREVRQELRQRAQEAREALEEADRKMKEAKGHTHPVTPEEQKVLDQQRQERKDSSSYSYYTSSEDEPGEELRLVPNTEVKEDPKDPSSSESSSDDDDEGEEEELEADPDEEAREAVEENKGENSEESELFESSEAPIASGKAARASKGKPALVEAKGQKVPVQLPSRPSAGTPKAMPSTLARAETKRLADDWKEMRRLREESRALDQADAENERERKRLQGELKALRQKRRAEDAAASVAEEERAKKKKAEDEAAAKEKAEEAEAQRKADEEEARRIAEEEEAQLKAEELQKAMEFADQLQKEAEKAERKAQKAATKAEKEPEESDQKAKKVRKAEKAKAKAELAMSKLKAERGAVSNLRWHGNRVGMPRIDFLHDKPEGWKEMWNQRLAAWKARHQEAQKKEKKEKDKGEQPNESGDEKKKSEPERPGHRLEAQRKIPMAQDPWSRPTVFWNQSWDRICELSRKKEGEGFVFFCGSQGCRKTFKTDLAYWQHLWSKCDTPGHPSREIVKRWSTAKPFVAVSGDPNHPDPQWVEKQQKELKEKMKKEIQDHEDEKAKKLRQAQGKEEESSSTGSGSTDSEDDDEVSKAAKKVGIAVESLGPVGAEDSDIPEILDGESLAAFLEDKKAEKAAKTEKVLAEESAASKRKSGVTEAGKRMLDQTLDEIVTDIQEEVPPSQRDALFGLPESPTSPAGAPAQESAGVESAPIAPTIPSTGIPISAVTEQEVPKDHDSKLETCKACAGSGRADPDMNEAIQVLLDAQKASMASVSQEVKKEDSPKGKDADSQDKDNRLGAFTFCEGVATDFCIVELCCNRFSELSRAAKVLGCSYLGIHDQLEVPSTCQQVLKTLRLAIAEGKKVEGKKVGRVYCHCSLPCTGGSPLLNFSDASIRERHQAKFLELLSCLTEYWEGIRRVDPQSLFSFELPHQNRYWKLADMRNFRTQWGLDFYGVVSGCRTGLMTDKGVPIGKRYRIIANHQEIAQRIHARFSQCVCTCDHASFNEIDWHDTEKYTKRFATFLVRTAFRVRNSLS